MLSKKDLNDIAQLIGDSLAEAEMPEISNEEQVDMLLLAASYRLSEHFRAGVRLLLHTYLKLEDASNFQQFKDDFGELMRRYNMEDSTNGPAARRKDGLYNH